MEYDISVLLSKLLLGLLVGAVGQTARAIVGLKKASDCAAAEGKNLRDVFDSQELVMSLIIGATAGALATFAFLDDKQLSKEKLLILLAAGYAGADFIEGFMRSQSEGLKSAQTPAASQQPQSTSPQLPPTPPPGPLPQPSPFPVAGPAPQSPATMAPLPTPDPFSGPGVDQKVSPLPQHNPFG